jgi:nucleoside-diphosphate-sugar epimerase
MRILVVGGTGFIGTPLVRQLCSLGHEVTVYHRGVHEPRLPAAVKHVRSPLAGIPVVAYPPSLRDEAFDVVVHLTLTGRRDAEAAVDAFRHTADRLVVASSCDVYARYGRLLGIERASGEERRDEAPLAEDAPLRRARFPYGKQWIGPWNQPLDYEKLLVEETVLASVHPRGTVLRLPAVYGPDDSHRRFMPWVKRMRDGRKTILMGRSRAGSRVPHGYVDNVAWAITLAATRAAASGRIYNVGEAETPSGAELVAAIGAAAGWKGEIVVLPDARMPAHLAGPYRACADLTLDTTRIREELDFREVVPPPDALRRTVAWESETGFASVDPRGFDYPAEDLALKVAGENGGHEEGSSRAIS